MKKKIIYFLVGVLFAGSIMASYPVFSSELSQNLQFAFNRVNLQVNGESVAADNILYNDTTYVPLRKVAEMLGKEVVWDQETQTAHINDPKDQIAHLGIEFIQGDKVYKVLENEEEINLEKDAFFIRFNLKEYDEENGRFYAAQIATVTNQYAFHLMDENKVAYEIPYYSPGTGLATFAQYDGIWICNDAHHYIFYDEQDLERARAELISKNQDILNLEWMVEKINRFDRDQYIKDSRLTELYFVMFFDNNLNGIVDKNEFAKVKINFN